ncbi:MAG: hypothetical protein FJZ90_08845 [Chloroflexi bacterium]|nr:hypothetical protein [Chloroflexota bacterium]
MSANGHLPTTWQVFSEWQRAPAEAIGKHLELASKRLGGPVSHILLHPDALASLGVELAKVREDGKLYTIGAWGGLTVLAIERKARKGLASQAARWDLWFGRDGQQEAQGEQA